jgi:hypothetical protein
MHRLHRPASCNTLSLINQETIRTVVQFQQYSTDSLLDLSRSLLTHKDFKRQSFHDQARRPASTHQLQLPCLPPTCDISLACMINSKYMEAAGAGWIGSSY